MQLLDGARSGQEAGLQLLLCVFLPSSVCLLLVIVLALRTQNGQRCQTTKIGDFAGSTRSLFVISEITSCERQFCRSQLPLARCRWHFVM